MTDAPYQPLPPDIAWRTPFDLLHRNSTQWPNKLALVASSAGGGEMRLSYAALAYAIDCSADALRQTGVARGDHLAVLMTNAEAAEYYLIAFGAMRLGAVAVLLNARMAIPELLAAVQDMGCRWLAHSVSFDGAALRISEKDKRFEGRTIRVGPSGDWERRFAEGRARKSGFPALTDADLADILLTSGTTGRAKGVMLTHGNAVATGAAVAGALDLRQDDTYQSPFPLFTSSGFHFNLMAALWAGATMVIEPAMDLPATLLRMKRERSTVYCAVPTAYIFMLDAYDRAQHDLSSIRIFNYGGAPMAKEAIRRLHAMAPQVELRQTYGLTEAGPSGTFLPGSEVARKLGSLGRSMPLCDVRVLRPDGRETDPGEPGEIAMRGPTVSQGYYLRPDATIETFHDGWLWTGDIAERDEDGYLYYLDRKKDVIIRGGFNITSVEVENAVIEHPNVKEVAVVSIPHDRLGEDVVAFVVPQSHSPPEPTALIDFTRERLTDYKVPRHWLFVDQLPRNPTGKVLKTELRTQARQKCRPQKSE